MTKPDDYVNVDEAAYYFADRWMAGSYSGDYRHAFHEWCEHDRIAARYRNEIWESLKALIDHEKPEDWNGVYATAGDDDDE